MKKSTVNKHHFTIVETMECGGPLLSIVPHQWVNGKFLMWPDKKAELLVKDQSSTPTPKWSKIPCAVKRRFIRTFSEAEFEAAEMSGHTDSDSQQLPPSKKFKTKGAVKGFQTDFNELMNQGPSTSHHSVTQPRNEPPASSSGVSAEILEAPTITQPDNVPIQLSQPTSDTEQPVGYILNAEPQLIDGDELKKEIFAKIEEERDHIIAEVTNVTLNAMETLITKTIAAVKCDFDNKMMLLQQTREQENDYGTEFQFIPVSSAAELEQLENNLDDKEYAKEVMKFIRNIIGQNGDDCNGLNTCYQIIDYFFDRKFMPNCSWTGASRGESVKCSIQNCKNIQNVFFAIVKSVNDGFSVKMMETFFKTMTKNAKKRSETKGLRQSSSHHRARKPTMAAVGVKQAFCSDGRTMNCADETMSEIDVENFSGGSAGD